MLTEIEAALVDRLSVLAAEKKVRLKPFPEDLRELKQPILAGQILIGYKQSTFRSLTNDPLTYEQLLQFDINTQVKGLRSHIGAYPLLDEIRFLLIGWRSNSPMQKRPAYFQAERLVDVDEGIWSYNQSLIVPLTIEAGKRAEFEPINNDLNDAWEGLSQIKVTIGLWRSPADRVAETDVSTKDSEVSLEIPTDG